MTRTVTQTKYTWIQKYKMSKTIELKNISAALTRQIIYMHTNIVVGRNELRRIKNSTAFLFSAKQLSPNEQIVT